MDACRKLIMIRKLRRQEALEIQGEEGGCDGVGVRRLGGAKRGASW